jgi:hypothetical protein
VREIAVNRQGFGGTNKVYIKIYIFLREQIDQVIRASPKLTRVGGY